MREFDASHYMLQELELYTMVSLYRREEAFRYSRVTVVRTYNVTEMCAWCQIYAFNGELIEEVAAADFDWVVYFMNITDDDELE